MSRHFAALNDKGVTLHVLVGERASGNAAWFEKNVTTLYQDRDDKGNVILIDGKPSMVKPARWIETFKADNPPTVKELEADASVLTRKNYAGLGHKYDDALDGFIAPRPEKRESWVLDDSLKYIAPVPEPVFDLQTQTTCWDEKNQAFVIVLKADAATTQAALDATVTVEKL